MRRSLELSTGIPSVRPRGLLLCAALLGLGLQAHPPSGAAPPACSTTAGLSTCLYPGRPPALVLLTGLGRAMDSWPPSFLEALNRSAAVLVYDRRGYGSSAPLPAEPRPGEPVTAEAASRDLEAVLARLGLGRVVLVGHSLGGLYAQFFARRYPQQVAAVVLLDAASPFEPLADPRFRTRAQLPPGSTDDRENRGLDASIRQIRQGPPFPPVPLLVISATNHQSPQDLEAEWQRIQARTARQSPLGQQIVAEGSGHDIHIDQPALVVARIEQLLLQLRAAPSR